MDRARNLFNQYIQQYIRSPQAATDTGGRTAGLALDVLRRFERQFQTMTDNLEAAVDERRGVVLHAAEGRRGAVLCRVEPAHTRGREPSTAAPMALSELMNRCAAGVSAHPQIGRAIGVTARVITQLSQQDLTLGGLIKAVEAIHKGASDGIQRGAAHADQVLGAAQTAVIAYRKGPGVKTTSRALEAVYQEPLQLLEQSRTAAQVAAARAVKQTRARVFSAEQRQQVILAFLQDAQALPVPAGKPSAPETGDAATPRTARAPTGRRRLINRPRRAGAPRPRPAKA